MASVGTSNQAAKSAAGESRATVYVYEAPVRIWHWINALCIVVLAVTGYFIGQPPFSVGGEASDSFWFGKLRFVHFAAGYVLAAAFAGRLYWALVGNKHARQIFYVPVWDGRWWAEVWHEIKWYAFAADQPKKYVGHNPLATLAMFFLFTLTVAFMILSGFALYAEGAGAGSWQHNAFGWMIAAFGDNSMHLHTAHRLGMWTLVVFAIVHIYAAVREDIMSRQSIISTMVSGERMFKDRRP